MKAKGLVLEKPHSTPQVEDIEVAPPGAGEVLVRLAASGVCGTDGHAIEGTHPVPKLPVVLGHEGAGVVEAVGADVETIKVGDHVVLALAVPCGSCRQCVRGLSMHCNSPLRRQAMLGIMADNSTRVSYRGVPAYPFFGVGTLAELTTVREEQAVLIDPELPLDELCLAGCGVVTGIGAALNVAKVQVGDTVVVVGCGGVGANVIQGARIAGASVIIAVDPVAEKLELARVLGATHTTDEVEGLSDFISGIEPDGADVVFEVVGRPELLAKCLGLTRVGGSCVMVGIPPAGSTLPIDAMTLSANRRLLGCRGGAVVPARDIARIASLYESGQLRLAELIGQRLKLDEVEKALNALGSSNFARSVVTFE